MNLAEHYKSWALNKRMKPKVERSINFKAFVNSIERLLVETRCHTVKCTKIDSSSDPIFWSAFETLSYPLTTTDFQGIHAYFESSNDPFLLQGFDDFIDRHASSLSMELEAREKIVIMGRKAYLDAKKNPENWKWVEELTSFSHLEKASLRRLLSSKTKQLRNN